jgi:hypothetical protein
MSAALASLPNQAPTPDVDLTPEAILRANRPPAHTGLGTAVRINPFGGRSKPEMKKEGVVIEVVPPGEPPRSAGISYPSTMSRSRSSVVRYVVECRDRRILRRRIELVVVSL